MELSTFILFLAVVAIMVYCIAKKRKASKALAAHQDDDVQSSSRLKSNQSRIHGVYVLDLPFFDDNVAPFGGDYEQLVEDVINAALKELMLDGKKPLGVQTIPTPKQPILYVLY